MKIFNHLFYLYTFLTNVIYQSEQSLLSYLILPKWTIFAMISEYTEVNNLYYDIWLYRSKQSSNYDVWCGNHSKSKWHEPISTMTSELIISYKRFPGQRWKFASSFNLDLDAYNAFLQVPCISWLTYLHCFLIAGCYSSHVLLFLGSRSLLKIICG